MTKNWPLIKLATDKSETKYQGLMFERFIKPMIKH